MVWEPSDAEIEAVSKLAGVERYSYFIKKVTDENRVWSLWKDDWVLVCDEAGREMIPVWPHKKYAEQSATGMWEDHFAKEIDLNELIDRWLPGIVKDNRLLAIFPNISDRGVVVDSIELASDIENEMSRYI